MALFVGNPAPVDGCRLVKCEECGKATWAVSLLPICFLSDVGWVGLGPGGDGVGIRLLASRLLYDLGMRLELW